MTHFNGGANQREWERSEGEKCGKGETDGVKHNWKMMLESSGISSQRSTCSTYEKSIEWSALPDIHTHLKCSGHWLLISILYNTCSSFINYICLDGKTEKIALKGFKPLKWMFLSDVRSPYSNSCWWTFCEHSTEWKSDQHEFFVCTKIICDRVSYNNLFLGLNG